jgi:hypothetical protein
MNSIELRIAVTEEMIRELLWHALTPEAVVMQQTLNDAIAQQQALREISLEGYELTGISVTVEDAGIHAELTYTATSVD